MTTPNEEIDLMAALVDTLKRDADQSGRMSVERRAAIGESLAMYARFREVGLIPFTAAECSALLSSSLALFAELDAVTAERAEARTITDAMVERAALVVWESRDNGEPDWESVRPHRREYFKRIARRTLDAMMAKDGGE